MTEHAEGRPLGAVHVTWMDGRQETYPATRYKNTDGVLLVVDVGPDRVLRDCWEIPLVNVRVFRPLFGEA